jgi:hypothetical protein
MGYGILRREEEDPPLHPVRARGSSCCALRDVPGARDHACLGYECCRLTRSGAGPQPHPARPDFRPGLQPVLSPGLKGSRDILQGLFTGYFDPLIPRFSNRSKILETWLADLLCLGCPDSRVVKSDC